MRERKSGLFNTHLFSSHAPSIRCGNIQTFFSSPDRMRHVGSLGLCRRLKRDADNRLVFLGSLDFPLKRKGVQLLKLPAGHYASWFFRGDMNEHQKLFRKKVSELEKNYVLTDKAFSVRSILGPAAGKRRSLHNQIRDLIDRRLTISLELITAGCRIVPDRSLGL